MLLHGFRDWRVAMLPRARMLHQLGYSVVMIDFQAHGESPGKYITVGYLEGFDARAAVEFARREHPAEPIGVIGASMGGAATLLASPLDIDALVVEAVYPTITAAIRSRVSARLGRFADVPAALLLTQLRFRLGISPDDLRPIDHMASVGCPVLLLSGGADTRTTTEETSEMFTAAREPKSMWVVDGAVHGDMYVADPAQYRQRIGEFFGTHLQPTTEATLP